MRRGLPGGLHLRRRRPLHDQPEECIDCGACEPECPVEAIYPEDEVPDDMESYTTKAADYFEQHEQVSLAGGSARCGSACQQLSISGFAVEGDLRAPRHSLKRKESHHTNLTS